MRAIDFLLEYNRQITQQKMGDAIAAAAQKDPTVSKMYRQVGQTVGEIEPKYLIQFILNNLEKTDPTPNKQYVQWLARVYANSWNKPTAATGTGMWFEDVVSTIAQYLHKFHELNRRKMLPRPENDINSFRDFNTFMYDMDQYQLPEKEEEVDRGNAFTLYEDENWRVLIPQDQSAACYYGRGTRWCTAATKGRNLFGYYNDIAPLMILLPKHPEHTGEKYQVHFGVSFDDGVGNSYPLKSDEDLDAAVDSWGEDLTMDDVHEYIEYGQIMNEQDDPISYTYFTNRVDPSWDNILNAYLQKFPDRRWQVYVNLDQLDGTDNYVG